MSDVLRVIAWFFRVLRRLFGGAAKLADRARESVEAAEHLERLSERERELQAARRETDARDKLRRIAVDRIGVARQSGPVVPIPRAAEISLPDFGPDGNP